MLKKTQFLILITALSLVFISCITSEALLTGTQTPTLISSATAEISPPSATLTPTIQPEPQATETTSPVLGVSTTSTLITDSMFSHDDQDFLELSSLVLDGEGQDGNHQRLEMKLIYQTQSQPETALRNSFSIGLVNQPDETHTVIVGDQGYYYDSLTGCTEFPTDTYTGAQAPSEAVRTYLTGQVELIESDVEVNGVLSDRYALEADNITTLSGDFLGGDLFISKDGIVTQFEYFEHTIALEDDSTGLFPGSSVEAYFLYRLLLDFSGPPISPPPICGGETGNDNKFPVIEDATAVVESSTGRSFYYHYTTSQTVNDVIDFYLSAMIAEGWALDDQVTRKYTTELIFTNDDRSASVRIDNFGYKTTIVIQNHYPS